MQNAMLKILNESGNLDEYKILFTFKCEELGKSYIVYDNNKLDENNFQVLFAASYDSNVELNKLEPITDEEELNMINGVLNQIIESKINQKYSYGYNVGWNVENTYIDHINDMMSEYNKQVSILERMRQSISNSLKNNSSLFPIKPVSEEQIRRWYNEDCILNGTLLPFEEYKKSILQLINDRNEKVLSSKEKLASNQDVTIENKNLPEYIPNLKILIDIKSNIKTEILKRRSQLELLLSETKMKLSSISLNQYDEVWLEMKKIEHALNYLNEMSNKVELTEEEYKLISKGLNVEEQQIYNELIRKREEKSIVAEEKKRQTLDKSEENITIDSVVNKISGGKFNIGYIPTRVKIFDNIQRDYSNYKPISIEKAAVGIIPKSSVKVYELFELNSSQIEENTIKLTDQEVAVLLDDYSKLSSIPNNFNNIVKSRVNLYVSKKINELNEKLSECLYNIACCEKIIGNTVDEEMLEDAYLIANYNIKKLISLQLETNILVNASHLHSFESQLKVLNTKLNYVGGRFETAKDYDSTLWSQVSGLSQKIEYSLDAKEVVDSYIQRQNIYKENNKHKNYLSEKDLKEIESLDYEYYLKFTKDKMGLEMLKNISNTNLPKKETSNSSKRNSEVKSLIDNLRAMKAEITQQDIIEIEELLKLR